MMKDLSGRRILSLWLPYFQAERAIHADAIHGEGTREGAVLDDPDRPVAVTRESGGRHLVVGVDGLAAGNGLAAGQSVSDARALRPDLRLVEEDPAADRAALSRLADWCGRYTPSVAFDPACAPAGGVGEAGLLLDVSGAAHLFGGEAALVADLVNRLSAGKGTVGRGWTVRVALADTVGAAWAVARFSGRRENVVPEGEAEAVLAPLPVAALRLPPATVEVLGRVGLRRIGDLTSIARAPLTARFGAELGRRVDRALGREAEPISPRGPVFPHRVRIALPEPVVTAEAIRGLARRLLGRLVERLEREHAGARRLVLHCYRVDGEVRRLTVGTGRPSRDADALLRLVEERLDNLDPGFGIDTLVLEAPVVEPAAPVAVSLDSRDVAAGRASVEALVDRLANRLGPEAVTRLEPVESHLPERAEVTRSVFSPGRAEGARPVISPGRAEGARPVISHGRAEGARPVMSEERSAFWTTFWKQAARRGRPLRPIRLLGRPEPVEATALLPDHPPARFRWRGVEYRVARSAGPERIAPEWWRAEPGEPRSRLTRDYFRVEDQDGRRWWLFREGLAERGEAPTWFLHGLFA